MLSLEGCRLLSIFSSSKIPHQTPHTPKQKLKKKKKKADSINENKH